jgi:excisionase family DNA binding protein
MNRSEGDARDEVPTAAVAAADRAAAPLRPSQWRESLRDQALQKAMRKRSTGVPTYTVPEAAALLSVSQEYLYRLIQAAAFPAVRMRSGGNQGRYVVPAKAIERLLDEATADSSSVESAEWSQRWHAGTAGSASASLQVSPQGGGQR